MLFNILARKIRVFTSTVLLKRDLLMQYAMFDESLYRHQDLQMLADFSAKAEIGVLNCNLVKIHQDSVINKPNLEKTIAYKEIYLKRMQEHIKKFTLRDQKRIYCAHHFEVVTAALKERKINVAIKYLFKVGLNIQAYRDFLKRHLG